MSEKTILVTGGAGFIGSRFVHHVISHYPDYNVIVLDSLTYAGSLDNLPPGAATGELPKVQFWYGNVCNPEIVNALVEKSDYVVHFAAETHVTRSIFDNHVFFQTDVLGTQTVANAVLKNEGRIKRFIHVSTSEVYGNGVTETMDEEHPLNPASPYASAKTGADRLVYSYWSTYDIPAVIVRPFNQYGPHQHLEKVVPRFVTSVLLNESLTVHGDGQSTRDFVYVEDTCRALDLVLHAPAKKVHGQAFNIATGNDISILKIAQDIVRTMNYDPGRIQFVGDRLGQVTRHKGSWKKIGDTLGWRPQVSWEEGLAGTIAWYGSRRATWDKQIPMRRILVRTKGGKIEFH